MGIVKKILRMAGLEKHDYARYMGQNYKCLKCGHDLYIPRYSEFYYTVKGFRGCKGEQRMKKVKRSGRDVY